MRAAGIIFGIVRNIFVAVIGGTAAVMVILYAAGNRYYVVQSGSMEPSIMTGAIEIVNSGYAFEKVAAGDVICFVSPNKKLVTHRVVNVSEKGLETKGDANTLSDGISTVKDNYRGRVWLSIPYIGFAAAKVLSSRGKIIIITALVMVLLLSFLPSESKRDKNDAGDTKNSVQRD